MRVLGFFVAMLLLALAGWLAFGERFEQQMNAEGLAAWLAARPVTGAVSACGLLISDLLLPVPGTVVMSALGWVYGVGLGGVVGTVGSVLSGLAGYGVGRWMGRSRVRILIGERDLRRAHRWFEKGGGWLVCLSRGFPLLPEAVACTAGLAKMPVGKFLLATSCGSLPVAFGFAWIGSRGNEEPGWVLALNLVIPALLWGGVVIARWVWRKVRQGKRL